MYSLHDSPINKVFPKTAKTAVILGNGPSMARFGLEFQRILANDNPVVFGVNRIFMDDYKMYWPVHYYIAIDRTCYKENHRDILGMRPLRCFIYNRFAQIADIPQLVSFRLNEDHRTISRDRSLYPGHNHTSLAVATQLALMQGAENLYFFGLDCAPDRDGKTHNHGIMRRNSRKWANITNGTLNMLECLRAGDIEYKIFSDLFIYCARKENTPALQMEPKQCL